MIIICGNPVSEISGVEDEKPQKGDFLIEEVIPGDYNVQKLIQNETNLVPVGTLNFYNLPFRTSGLHAASETNY